MAESTAATSSAAASAADPAVTKEITDAYTTFFNGKTPAADRTALIENPDGFSQVLVGMASDTRAQGTGVTVKGVTSPTTPTPTSPTTCCSTALQ